MGLRSFVRKHDIRLAKEVYKDVVAPLYRLAGIPLYDITASAKYRYTWFRIPKNGTHSVMDILKQHAPPELNSSYVPYYRSRHRNNFKFCVIRNPWDRLVSVYCNKVQMKLMYPECWDKGFPFFIDYVSGLNLLTADGHLRLQTAMFPVKEVDSVARIESFTRDMDEIFFKILGEHVEIPHSGSVDHEEYRTYYSEATRERVAELYQDDISFGKYVF